MAQLEAVTAGSQELLRAQQERGTVERGIYVEFESEPGFPLKVESLEDRRRGLELVAVAGIGEAVEEAQAVRATVFVREGQLDLFLNKVEQYLTNETRRGQPKNRELIESISEVRLATVRGLWTDAGPFPEPAQRIWWEAWLRAGDSGEEKQRISAAFREQASAFGLRLSENQLDFPENTVLLVQASADDLSRSVFLLNALAELREAKEAADFFYDMPQAEQVERVREAGGRVRPPAEDAPAVCLLDTGVNNGHPMLELGLRAEDMSAYNPAWGTADHNGHGTEMAGLGLYGDLVEVLGSAGDIELTHRLESVKILPPDDVTEPDLYGEVTAECVARAEIMAPERERAICLTVTTTEFRDRGQPSSWSAAIDQVCSGALEDELPRHRLMLISAGNTDYNARGDYPDSNYTDGVHDPGQSWNAVTVGAYTDKDSISPDRHPESTPLAARGGLCPSSTTSLVWDGQWPLKPDVVFEGGNMATHPSYTGPYELESLRLLTTNAEFQQRLLTLTGDTSAAAALGARAAAVVMAEYPEFWPETVRGLLVHSARWTPAMVPRDGVLTRREIENLLRVFGFGVPGLTAALYSARNSLTLISQNAIRPFFKKGAAVKTNEMHLHELPWPGDVLRGLGEVPCEMRVTLSYFVEPNPTRRGYKNRYRYASHGLRFDTKTPTESADDFRRRINQTARGEVETFEGGASDAASWLLGPYLRTRGSLHSDVWRGTAAELADKGYIAIYPALGWWKELKRQERWDSRARYSLIVSLRTQDVNIDVDIYTPVTNLVLV